MCGTHAKLWAAPTYQITFHGCLGPFMNARLRSELELAEAASQAGSSAGVF